MPSGSLPYIFKIMSCYSQKARSELIQELPPPGIATIIQYTNSRKPR